MSPLPLDKYLFGEDIINSEINIEFKVMGITSADDYQIFNYMKMKNYQGVAEMIDNKKGVNALDEWGQSILMLAARENELTVVATLLNARMPKVNVNAAKSSGYTALFYAIENRDTNILKALLRRGANPNVLLKQEGAVGNTPLHFSCLMEKQKHTELLLEYGADVMAVNEYGQYPLQLLPRESVRSTKLYFKRMFEDALAKHEKENNADSTKNVRQDL
jgi:ankyrin repeat protein